jgi:ABC-type multidrug transport system fused ATPase/permease subunit
MSMSDEPRDISEENAPGKTRRKALSELLRVLSFTPNPAWVTPALVILGLLSSLAETVGITLVLLFFYSAMGQLDTVELIGGLFGNALRQASAWLGSPAKIASGVLVLIVARGLLAFAYSVLSADVSERISEIVRNLLHRQYLSVSYSFVRLHEQAQLMEVLGTESWLIAKAYTSLTRLIVNCCSIFVFAAFLLAVSWQITLIALAGSLIISFVLRRLSEPARILGERVKHVHQGLSEQMLMTLQGMRTIRAYGQQDFHEQRFARFSSEARSASMALARLSSMLNPLTEIGYLGILGVIIFASGLWSSTFVTTLAAVALLYRLQPCVRELEGNLLYMAQIQPQLSSVRRMLETSDKDYPSPGHRPIASIAKGLRFQNVTFRYQSGGVPALADASFEIPVGGTTALVGASGAGKTTIINLLLRLYQPSSGTIFVDDAPMDEIVRADWVSLLAVAGQDVDLIEGTVIENIRMADSNATEEDVVAASHVAGVAEFISDLPEGYETWIGQQGTRFSGGQRQRIGLARAILRDPQILMLDEAMSALDRGLESQIRRAIEKNYTGRTILIITHRVETVLNANHVIHIEQGRVAAQGPPQDLLLDPDGALFRALAPDKPRNNPLG